MCSIGTLRAGGRVREFEVPDVLATAAGAVGVTGFDNIRCGLDVHVLECRGEVGRLCDLDVGLLSRTGDGKSTGWMMPPVSKLTLRSWVIARCSRSARLTCC